LYFFIIFIRFQFLFQKFAPANLAIIFRVSAFKI